MICIITKFHYECTMVHIILHTDCRLLFLLTFVFSLEVLYITVLFKRNSTTQPCCELCQRGSFHFSLFAEAVCFVAIIACAQACVCVCGVCALGCCYLVHE
jgi:hypothetical protein